MIISKISLDILSLILLMFLLYLISRNRVMTKRSSKHFIISIVLTLIVILAEIGSVIFNIPNFSFQIPNIIINIIGFSISPFIAIRIAFLYDEDIEKKKLYISIPLIINALICIFSSYTGWVFEIVLVNQYKRGPLFFIYVLCSIYAFVVLIYANYKNARIYQKGDKIYLYGLYFLVLFGNVVQIAFPNILVIWGCISISLVLYYIFLRELQFKYDPLTNTLNRHVFERAMEELTYFEEATVIVFDLNNLKNINDTYGHSVGDSYIVEAAKIIQESYAPLGKCYRIGGDEFCVLSRITEENKIQISEEKMLKQIEEYESIWKKYFNIAYGYAFYNKKTMKNIYVAFTEADKKMYIRKELSKKKNDCLELLREVK